MYLSEMAQESPAPWNQSSMGILKNLAGQARDLGQRKALRQLHVGQGSRTDLRALVRVVEKGVKKRDKARRKEPQKMNEPKKNKAKTRPKSKTPPKKGGHQSTPKRKAQSTNPTRKKAQPYETLRQRKQALAKAMKKGCTRAGATSIWRLDDILWDCLGAYRAYLMRMTTDEFGALLRRQNADGTFMMEIRLRQLGQMIWKASGITVPSAVGDEAVKRMHEGGSGQIR